MAQCDLYLGGELVARGSAEMRERHTSSPRIGGVTSHADHEGVDVGEGQHEVLQRQNMWDRQSVLGRR